MHLVAPLGRAEMCETGASHENMGGVLVVDWRKDTPLLECAAKVDRLADPAICDQLAQRDLLGNRLARKVERRAGAFDKPALATGRNRESPLSVVLNKLGEFSWTTEPFVWVEAAARRDQRANPRIGEIGRGDGRARCDQNVGAQCRGQADHREAGGSGGAYAGK